MPSGQEPAEHRHGRRTPDRPRKTPGAKRSLVRDPEVVNKEVSGGFSGREAKAHLLRAYRVLELDRGASELSAALVELVEGPDLVLRCGGGPTRDHPDAGRAKSWLQGGGDGEIDFGDDLALEEEFEEEV